MRDTSAAGRASSLEHDPADALRKPSRGQSQWLKRLAGSARPPLLLAGAAPLAGGVLLVIQAWLLASVLDAAIARQAPRSDLLGGILGIAALMLVRACIAWAGERAGAIAAERIKRQVRLALFERLVDKGPHWSRGQASGVLASAVVDQVEALDGFFAKYLPAMAAAAMLPVAFSVLLFPVDVIAGLVLLITAPLIPLFMALVGWGAQGASRRHLRAFARLSGFFADRLRGLSTLAVRTRRGRGRIGGGRQRRIASAHPVRAAHRLPVLGGAGVLRRPGRRRGGRVHRADLSGFPGPALVGADLAGRHVLPVDGARGLCAAASVRRALP